MHWFWHKLQRMAGLAVLFSGFSGCPHPAESIKLGTLNKHKPAESYSLYWTSGELLWSPQLRTMLVLQPACMCWECRLCIVVLWGTLSYMALFEASFPGWSRGPVCEQLARSHGRAHLLDPSPLNSQLRVVCRNRPIPATPYPLRKWTGVQGTAPRAPIA